MPKTLAEILGFAADARVAIVHCDDIGICHEANAGAFAALDTGPATCGSVMVPCPGFAEAAAWARERDTVDLGVHLTLTSEWTKLRWGPVADRARVPSLVDPDGAFPPTTREVISRASLDEVELELRAQIDRALDAGIDVTHLDAHMATALLPPLLDVYVRLALAYQLPVFIVRPDPQTLAALGGESAETHVARALRDLEAGGIPILDGMDANSLHFAPGEGEAHNAARIAGLQRGINYLICHPAMASPELDRITPNAHCRDFERVYYGGELGRRALKEAGVQTVGMRPLRDWVRRR